MFLGGVEDLVGERALEASSRTRGEAVDLVRVDDDAIFFVRVLVDLVGLVVSSGEEVLLATFDLVTLLPVRDSSVSDSSSD